MLILYVANQHYYTLIYMILNNYRIILFLLICLSFVRMNAQVELAADDRKNEADVKIEDRFISAKLLITAGKKDDAIKLLDSIRRESGQVAAVYFELAKLYNEKKEINLTESNLSAAVKIEPSNKWIRLFEVNFLKELGRYEDAIKTLKYLSSLDLKEPDLYDQIVSLYIKNKDLQAALVTLDTKELNVGFSVNTILKRAEIYDNAGDVAKAVSELDKLTKKFPLDINYLRLIANMLHSNDKVKDAEPYLKRILAIDPNDTDARLGLVLLSNKSVSKEDYLLTLTPLVSNPDAPIDLKIKELLPYVQRHADTRDTILGKQLIGLCDRLVIAHPNDAKSHAIYGDVLMNNGDVTAAIRQYEKTLSINDRNFMVWEQLMYGLETLENYDELVKVSLQAIDLFPNQAISYYFNGKALAAKNEFKKAFSSLDEASLISAGSVSIESRVLTVKGELFLKQKNLSKAMEFVDQALEISNYRNSAAYELKGDIYKEQNDLKKAIIAWNQSKDLGNNTERLSNKLKLSIGN